jgi:hypothetical protein
VKSHPFAIALIGGGGSGKSTLAAALGHRVEKRFPGGVHWFRIGAFSVSTVLAMFALRFGTRHSRPIAALKRHFAARGDSFIVLDNHEDDRTTAALLDDLRGAPVTWVVTARRCLLGGMTIFPVTPPLATRGLAPYRAVADLTKLLRHNPLSLSIADALVRHRQVTSSSLRGFLLARGVDRVRVIEDEDDLPEVRLLVEWVWPRLHVRSRRVLTVLAHLGGDHADRGSLGALTRVGSGIDSALAQLRDWQLIQEPFVGRYTLHATVRRAVRARTQYDAASLFEHYVALLEASPERLEHEQTHLFAAMDYGQEHGDLASRVRLEALLRELGI